MSKASRPLIHTVPPESGGAMGPIHTLQQTESREAFAELPGELAIAASVASKAVEGLDADSAVDRLICIGSVPLQVPHMGAFTLADAIGIVPRHVLDLGNHCAATLDGLWLATTLYKAESNLLIAATELGAAVTETMAEDKPGSRQWCDGASAVIIGGEGGRFIRPLGYVTMTDPSLYRMLDVCPRNGGYDYDFRDDVAARFQEQDLENELLVIREALADAGTEGSDLAGIVVVNRGRRRTLMLAPAFGVEPELVISSRNEIGHGGGSDTFYNLDLLLKQAGPGKHRIVIVGNGLGYAWSAMVVEIDEPGPK